MTDKKVERLPYKTPTLRAYGPAEILIRTVSETMNRNDAIQGQNALKT